MKKDIIVGITVGIAVYFITVDFRCWLENKGYKPNFCDKQIVQGDCK